MGEKIIMEIFKQTQCMKKKMNAYWWNHMSSLAINQIQKFFFNWKSELLVKTENKFKCGIKFFFFKYVFFFSFFAGYSLLPGLWEMNFYNLYYLKMTILIMKYL